MKKIVIDARESGTSTGRYVDKLIEHLHALKPDYEFCILAYPHRHDYLHSIAPTFEIIKTTHKEFTFDEQIGLLKQLKGLKADLSFFPMVQQPVFYKGRVVTTMQDLTTVRFRDPYKNPIIYSIKQAVYKWVNKRVAKKSEIILTPTEYVKIDVANYCHINPNKIIVTYEAADKIPDKSEPIHGLSGKDFLLFVGRPAANKNLNRLVDAFALLRQDNPELLLVLAGKTNHAYEQLKKYADAKTRGVVFTDFVSESQLRWLYEHTKAYVFPSLSEGFGLPGLEAMIHGAPVVSSNATCLPEVYKDAAYYFDPNDINDIVTRTYEVISNPKLSKELREKGLKLARTYSWEQMAQQTLDAFDKAIAD